MQVVVDGEPTDQFGRPGPDEELGDFIDSIADRLSASNQALSTIRVDGEPYDPEYESRPCSRVDRLELEISSVQDLTIQSIGELGEYCHRFLNRLPDILESWEDETEEQYERYRNQVQEALGVAREVLNTADHFFELEESSASITELRDRAMELRSTLASSEPDQLRSILKSRVKSFIQDLLSELQDFLDELEEQEENLLEDARRVEEQIQELVDRLDTVLETVQKQSANGSAELDLETVRDLAERLSAVDRTLENLDQAGKFRSAFPAERYPDIKDTLNQLYEGIGEIFSLVEEEAGSRIETTLRQDVRPALRKAREYVDEMTQQPGTETGEVTEFPDR